MSRLSVSDYLAALGPYLPEALVPRQNLADMQTLARPLPGAWTDSLGFEQRPGTA